MTGSNRNQRRIIEFLCIRSLTKDRFYYDARSINIQRPSAGRRPNFRDEVMGLKALLTKQQEENWKHQVRENRHKPMTVEEACQVHTYPIGNAVHEAR